MNPKVIGNHALNERQNRTAHDRHIQNAGTVSGNRGCFHYAQGENSGEHDRVEETDDQNGSVSAIPGPCHEAKDKTESMSYPWLRHCPDGTLHIPQQALQPRFSHKAADDAQK